jgi:hypothetical protein
LKNVLGKNISLIDSKKEKLFFSEKNEKELFVEKIEDTYNSFAFKKSIQLKRLIDLRKE